MGFRNESAGEKVSSGALFRNARRQYSDLISLSRTAVDETNKTYPVIYKRIRRVAADCVKTVQSNPFLLNMFLFNTLDDYLYAHGANVAILSAYLADECGFGESEKTRLFAACVLHDTGMFRYLPLAKKEKKFTDCEAEIIREHVGLSRENMDKIADFDYSTKEEVAETVLSSHEKYDGSGYPDGLRGEEMSAPAKIISLADAYEAMTHSRPWRPAMDPHRALRILIEEENHLFDPALVGKCADVLSLYPPGSFVRLSDGRFGEVFRANRESFSRPAVKILKDEKFADVRPYIVDLADNKLVSIDRAVTCGELEKTDPKCKGRTEIERVWVNW